MSFSDDLGSCMSPLPAPTVDGVEEVMEWLHELHTAWEASGGETEMLLTGLVAAGAVTGIDEAALGTAGALTVGVYIAALTACIVTTLGPSIWDALTAPAIPSWLLSQLTAQAETQGIERP